MSRVERYAAVFGSYIFRDKLSAVFAFMINVYERNRLKAFIIDSYFYGFTVFGLP